MAKMYRTSRGKSVDLAQILNENETVRAVGNMNVNARGDTLDSQNEAIQSRNDRIKNQYRRQHKNRVVDDNVPAASAKSAPKPDELDTMLSQAHELAKEYTAEAQQVAEHEAKPPRGDKEVKQVADPKAVVEKPTKAAGGLANAIARARESKQEMMKTPRQEARESSGVKKI